jgi:hypothetical protein
MSKIRLLPVLACCLALAPPALAQFAPGEGGSLVGGDRLRVPRCGRQAGPIQADVTLDPSGAWSADLGAATYAGTSTAPTPRLRLLTLDAASLAALEASLEADATALCEEAVTIDALNVNAALKVNKRRDRARIYLRARALGSSASGTPGTGLYQLRAGGMWITNT